MTDTSTNTGAVDIDELKRLAEKATPGEWHGQAVVGYRGTLFEVRANTSWKLAGSIPDAADAAFIAAANPQTVLALIAQVETLRAELEEARRLMSAAYDGWRKSSDVWGPMNRMADYLEQDARQQQG